MVRAGSGLKVVADPEEAFLPLGGLDVHVRDLDAFDDTDRRPRRESEPGVVCMDVHLECGLVADDEEGISERLEHALQGGLVESLPFDDEHRAVPVRRQLQMDRVESQSLARNRCVRERLAGNSEGEPAGDLDQPGASRIDDPCVAEHIQHLGCAGDRVLPSGEHGREELRGREAAVLLALPLLGHLADDGEHRPLDRALDRSVGGIARTPERTAKAWCARVVGTTEHVDEPADDLREDHARVPSSAHQRSARDLLRDRLAAFGARFVERLDDRP